MVTQSIGWLLGSFVKFGPYPVLDLSLHVISYRSTLTCDAAPVFTLLNPKPLYL